MSQFSANLNVMIKAARKAARGLTRDFGEVENLQVHSKSAGDFVSRADIRSEEVIREELRLARPTYGWIGEETGTEDGEDPTRYWIVDPLDGTTNFLHGIPQWSVSIALKHRKEIVSAVILDPLKNELFIAEKGAGAWMNDRRIRVSDRSEMLSCVFATGIPFGAKPGLPDTIRQIAKLAPACAGIRRAGSAALDLAWVAAGRLDGYWEDGMNPWDLAAGDLIVREAGGLVAPYRDGDDAVMSGEIIAANDGTFNTLVDIIRSA